MGQTNTIAFKEMYKSILKAKQILIALFNMLGLGEQDEGAGIIGNLLGKRQRTQ
jgi:hypothetical protein